MEAILSIDAGTTALKVAVFDRNLRRLGLVENELVLDSRQPGLVEFDADGLWRDVCRTVRRVLDILPPDCAVTAVSVCSYTDTLVAVDGRGAPVAPGIFWYDNRAEQQAREARARFTGGHFFRVTGQPAPTAIMQAMKLRWFLRKRQEAASRARLFFQTADYLLYRLSGRAVLDRTIACGSGLTSLETGTYWPEMLDFVGVEEERLPEIVTPGAALGRISRKAAGETLLPLETEIVVGAMDQIAASVAVGNIRPGVVSECTGASLAVCATVESPVYDPAGMVPCFFHAAAGQYLLLPWCETGGLVLRWFRDNFYQAARASGEHSDLYEKMTQEAAAVKPGCDGLLALPYLAGGGPPDFSPSARAAFVGITLGHKRGHFVRSLMEAVAFMLRDNVTLLENMGLPVDCMLSLGGGAKSDLWCQIKADVLDRPLKRTGEQETAALGTAILAGLGSGLFRSMDEALALAGARDEAFAPQPGSVTVYDAAYSAYRDLRKRLAPLHASASAGQEPRGSGPS